MSLRSVNPYSSYQVLLDLQRTKDQMANLSEQIASGNRLNRLGNDPTASALVLNFQDSIQKNEAYIKQAKSAASFLQTTETTLTSATDSIMRLLELGTQGAGATTASGRTALASEVSGIRDTLLALANTQSQGKYLFAGTNTTTKPFDLTPGTPPTWPLVYAGNNGDISLDTSSSTSVSTNIPGDTTFFDGAQGSNGDIFAQVTNLLTGLNTNDTVMIQGAVDNLRNTVLTHITTLITDLGGRQASLTQQTDNLESYNLSLQDIQNSYAAVDYPTAITDYTQAETSQQASLSILGKMNTLSLFNYLG